VGHLKKVATCADLFSPRKPGERASGAPYSPQLSLRVGSDSRTTRQRHTLHRSQRHLPPMSPTSHSDSRQKSLRGPPLVPPVFTRSPASDMGSRSVSARLPPSWLFAVRLGATCRPSTSAIQTPTSTPPNNSDPAPATAHCLWTQAAPPLARASPAKRPQARGLQTTSAFSPHPVPVRLEVDLPRPI
jgi:hypothetical protein